MLVRNGERYPDWTLFYVGLVLVVLAVPAGFLVLQRPGNAELFKRKIVDTECTLTIYN